MVIEIDMTSHFPFKDNSHAGCKMNAGKFSITTLYVATAVNFRVNKVLYHTRKILVQEETETLYRGKRPLIMGTSVFLDIIFFSLSGAHTHLDYQHSLFFLGPSSKTPETRK